MFVCLTVGGGVMPTPVSTEDVFSTASCLFFSNFVISCVKTFHNFIGYVKFGVDIESGCFLEYRIVSSGLVVILDEFCN